MKDLRGTPHFFHHVRKSGKMVRGKTIEQSPALARPSFWTVRNDSCLLVALHLLQQLQQPQALSKCSKLADLCELCATKEKANSYGHELLRAEVCLLHSTVVVLIAKLVKWRNWPYHPLAPAVALPVGPLSSTLGTFLTDDRLEILVSVR